MPTTVRPSLDDGVVRAASEVAGGPAGRHVGDGPHAPWFVARLLVVAVTAVVAVAAGLRQHCRSTLWASPDQFTHACYSDLPAVYLGAGLDRGVVPYLEAAGGAHLTQPVGTGGLLWLLAQLVPSTSSAQPRWFFDLGVVLVAASAALLVVAVLALSGRRPWDAALVALSPVLLTASLISLDLVAVTLATCAVWAFSRRRPVVAGVLLGLAVAVRPTALVVLVALLLLAVRTGRGGPVVRVALAGAAAWAAVNLPVLLANPGGWAAYPRSLLESPLGYGSLWLLPQLAGYPLPAVAGRWLAAVGTLVVIAAVAAVVLSAPRRPRLAAVVLLLVVGVQAVAVAVPVQAALWVLPFAALAVHRWRDLLLWGGVEAAYATGTWFYLYGQSEASRGLPAWAYGTLLVARVAATAWLAWQVLRAVRDPALDPVRSPSDEPDLGRDDPASGALEDAPDALVLRFT